MQMIFGMSNFMFAVLLFTLGIVVSAAIYFLIALIFYYRPRPLKRGKRA